MEHPDSHYPPLTPTCGLVPNQRGSEARASSRANALAHFLVRDRRNIQKHVQTARSSGRARLSEAIAVYHEVQGTAWEEAMKASGLKACATGIGRLFSNGVRRTGAEEIGVEEDSRYDSHQYLHDGG